MNIIIWLIIGGVVGWLASIVMRRDGQQGERSKKSQQAGNKFHGGFARPRRRQDETIGFRHPG